MRTNRYWIPLVIVVWISFQGFFLFQTLSDDRYAVIVDYTAYLKSIPPQDQVNVLIRVRNRLTLEKSSLIGGDEKRTLAFAFTSSSPDPSTFALTDHIVRLLNDEVSLYYQALIATQQKYMDVYQAALERYQAALVDFSPQQLELVVTRKTRSSLAILTGRITNFNQRITQATRQWTTFQDQIVTRPTEVIVTDRWKITLIMNALAFGLFLVVLYPFIKGTSHA